MFFGIGLIFNLKASECKSTINLQNEQTKNYPKIE